MRFGTVAASLFVAAACSGSSSGGGSASAAGSGSVSGTLLGKSFQAADAASYTTPTGVTIALYDTPGLCGYLTSNAIKANSSSLIFTIASRSSGSYAGVNVQYALFDATCHSSVGESGSGSVDVTSSDANMISGTLHMSLNGDTITGSFDAPNCAGAPGSGTQSCR
jgi:hypothetical protein